MGTVSTADSFAATEVPAIQIPDPAQDQAFLYNDWRANRANVVAIIDPLCPYCKRAFSKLDQVTEYNLFVYWAPIFGQRSEDIIAPFFQCEHPTGRPVLQSLIAAGFTADNKPLVCEGDVSASRRARNDEMVASYPVNGVPAFFLQGTPVSLSQILSVQSGPAAHINGVAIDWQRYAASRVVQDKPSRSLAIILPDHQNRDLTLQLLQQYRPAYIFSRTGWQSLCAAIAADCEHDERIERARSQQYSEIVALLGVDSHPDKTYLLSLAGRLSAINNR
tara:strand:- start:724 stop:1554 length:831 start_codon:yes stop_codon:yes gene_type:complete